MLCDICFQINNNMFFYWWEFGVLWHFPPCREVPQWTLPLLDPRWRLSVSLVADTSWLCRAPAGFSLISYFQCLPKYLEQLPLSQHYIRIPVVPIPLWSLFSLLSNTAVGCYLLIYITLDSTDSFVSMIIMSLWVFQVFFYNYFSLYKTKYHVYC